MDAQTAETSPYRSSQSQDISTLLKVGYSASSAIKTVFPLHAAVAAGNLAAVAMLIKSGFPINQRALGGFTPLHLACDRYGAEAEWLKASDVSRQIIEILLDHGADLEAVENQDRRPTALLRGYSYPALKHRLASYQAVQALLPPPAQPEGWILPADKPFKPSRCGKQASHGDRKKPRTRHVLSKRAPKLPVEVHDSELKNEDPVSIRKRQKAWAYSKIRTGFA